MSAERGEPVSWGNLVTSYPKHMYMQRCSVGYGDEVSNEVAKWQYLDWHRLFCKGPKCIKESGRRKTKLQSLEFLKADELKDEWLQFPFPDVLITESLTCDLSD